MPAVSLNYLKPRLGKNGMPYQSQEKQVGRFEGSLETCWRVVTYTGPKRVPIYPTTSCILCTLHQSGVQSFNLHGFSLQGPVKMFHLEDSTKHHMPVVYCSGNVNVDRLWFLFKRSIKCFTFCGSGIHFSIFFWLMYNNDTPKSATNNTSHLSKKKKKV